METRIPQLPPNTTPVDQANSLFELAIPDVSSDTGFSSVSIPVCDIAALVTPPAIALFNYYNFI